MVWGRCGGMEVGVGQSQQRCACKSGRGRSPARRCHRYGPGVKSGTSRKWRGMGDWLPRLYLDLVPKEGWRVQTEVTKMGSSYRGNPVIQFLQGGECVWGEVWHLQ